MFSKDTLRYLSPSDRGLVRRSSHTSAHSSHSQPPATRDCWEKRGCDIPNGAVWRPFFFARQRYISTLFPSVTKRQNPTAIKANSLPTMGDKSEKERSAAKKEALRPRRRSWASLTRSSRHRERKRRRRSARAGRPTP